MAYTPDAPLVTLDDLAAAQHLVSCSSHCVRTPLLQDAEHMFSCIDPSVKLFLKLENMQTTGSFKIRGIISQLQKLPPGSGTENKLLTMSAGNYGKGFAYMVRQLGLKGMVLMPETAPENRATHIKDQGLEVERMPSSLLMSKVDEYVANQGMLFLHPFDDVSLIAGHGSVGMEIVEDVPDVDVVLVCCGGGGLLAGTAAAIKLSGCHDCRVYGVEPETAKTMFESFRAGHAVKIPSSASVAAGLAPPFAGSNTYRNCRKHVDDIILVTDDEILAAMFVLYKRGLVVEPSGAAAFAALQTGKVPDVKGKKVVVVVTGGNIAPAEWTNFSTRVSS